MAKPWSSCVTCSPRAFAAFRRPFVSSPARSIITASASLTCFFSSSRASVEVSMDSSFAAASLRQATTPSISPAYFLVNVRNSCCRWRDFSNRCGSAGSPARYPPSSPEISPNCVEISLSRSPKAANSLSVDPAKAETARPSSAEAASSSSSVPSMEANAISADSRSPSTSCSLRTSCTSSSSSPGSGAMPSISSTANCRRSTSCANSRRCSVRRL